MGKIYKFLLGIVMLALSNALFAMQEEAFLTVEEYPEYPFSIPFVRIIQQEKQRIEG